MYRIGLNADGIAVTTAGSAEDGMFIAGIRQFDAIVLTVVERGNEQWRECAQLRAHRSTSSLPLVLVSASVREDGATRARARRLGCAAFVAKPCLPEQLAAVVRRVVAGESRIEEVRLPC